MKYKLILTQLIQTFQNYNTLFVAGNGGSAADCQHLCGELLKGFELKRSLNTYDKEQITRINSEDGKQISESLQYGLPVISLLSHLSYLTAYSNDVNYQNVFAQQLFVLGKYNDCVIGFSTSGNSQNIYNMFIVAKSKGIKTILFTGNTNGKCAQYADIIYNAQSNRTYEIQEEHLKIYHKLCLDLEQHFFKKQKAFFLDRDGIINYDVNYLNNIQDIKILDGVLEAITLMKQYNYKVIVISNQGGIAKGLLTEEQLIEINNKINELLNNQIDKFYYCPHHPTISTCTCRKPSHYLINKACEDFNIDVTQSYMIGDKDTDVQTGINAGCKQSIKIAINTNNELLQTSKRILNEIDN